jgi:hypothetical protein
VSVLRAIILPAMAEAADPTPAAPPDRGLPRLRRPARPGPPPAGPATPPPVPTTPSAPQAGLPAGDIVTRSAAGHPAERDHGTPPWATSRPDPSRAAERPIGSDATSHDGDRPTATSGPVESGLVTGPSADDMDAADQAPDIIALLPRRNRRRVRAAVAAVAAALLIGPLAYSFATGPGGQPPRAVIPPVALTQPWPQESGQTPLPSPLPSLAAGTPNASTDPTPTSAPTSAPTARSSATAGPRVETLASQPAAAAGGSTPTTAAAKPASTVKTAGIGCANDSSQNWYTNGMDGSWSQKTGGSSVCGSQFLAMPMSGSPTTDGNPYVVWWFETSPVITGSCAVQVYIPSSGIAADVAGRPAYYAVLGGRTSTTVQAMFTIDQTVNRGKWVAAGAFAVRNGAISIHLKNRGAHPNGERIGAGQVRVSCTPS